MTIRPVVSLLGLTLTALLLAGCHGGGGAVSDKAGGSQSRPVVLRLGSNDLAGQVDTPAIRYFAAQVARLSRGRLRIRILLDAGGDRTPRTEGNIIRKVQSGKLDLGWIGARAWDRFGVTSFEALQAPFLITSYALLVRVTSSALATRMLDGLDGQDVVGLALVPMELRHPIGGLKHPFVALSDFRDARVRNLPSRVGDELLRALGATPVHVSNAGIASAIAHGRVDGQEVSLGTAGTGSVVTANITFFPKALTLFAGRKAFEALAPDEQSALRTAAGRTLRHVLANPPWHGVFARYCQVGGRIVLASKRDLAGLERAARPVYAHLDRDAQTRARIGAIRRLKATTPDDPPLVIPAGCRFEPVKAEPFRGRPRSPSIVNGTYRLLFTKEDARAFGYPADSPENMKTYPGAETRVLNDGKWRFAGGSGPHGMYKIRGKRITLTSTTGEQASFEFSLQDGTLRLNPILPMDPGNQWVDAGEPWHRLGPPSPLP